MRSGLRRLASRRGLLAIAALLLFVGGLAVLLRDAGAHESLGWARNAASDPELLAIALLAGVVATVLTTRGSPLRLYEAEENLLSTAPVSRSALVVYKQISYVLGAVLSAFLLASVSPMGTPSRVHAFIAALCTLSFVQSTSAVASMLLPALRPLLQLNGVQRASIATALCAVAALLVFGAAALVAERPTLAISADQSTVRWYAHGLPAALLAPFAWVAGLWSPVATIGDLFTRAAGVLGLVVCFGFAIVRLDAAIQSNSTRTVGPGFHTRSTRAAPARRESCPAPRGMAGVVPLAWVGALALWRGQARTLIALAAMAAIGGAILAAKTSVSSAPNAAAAVVFALLFVLPKILTQDFRADRRTSALLRVLPIAPLRICTAQLIVPVLVAIGLQWTALLSAALFVEQAWRLPLLALAGFLVPFTLLHYAVENLLYLCAPARQAPIGRVDFDFLGRTLLDFLVKSVLLGAAIGLAALAGVRMLVVDATAVAAAYAVALTALAVIALTAVQLLTVAYRRL